MPESTQSSKHYDAEYFRWQEQIGVFGAWADLRKFANTIQPGDTVIDFGCGGGFLLEKINCGKRIGIEPNPSISDFLRAKKIRHFFNSIDALCELGEGIADVVISNHALEHTLSPLQELKNLLTLLKPRGIFHIFVPCDAISMRYNPNDINHHLFTWNSQNLANLFSEAGYIVNYSRPYIHKWPPFYRQLSTLGWPVFNIVCRVYGQIDRRSFQVELKATRPPA